MDRYLVPLLAKAGARGRLKFVIARSDLPLTPSLVRRGNAALELRRDRSRNSTE